MKVLLKWLSISCIIFCGLLALSILFTSSSYCEGSSGLACLFPFFWILVFGWWVVPIAVGVILGIVEVVRKIQ